jgi:hypothetical protein
MDKEQGAAARGPFRVRRDVSLTELVSTAVVALGVVAWFVRTGDTTEQYKAFMVQQRTVDEKQDARTDARVGEVRTELRDELRVMSAKLDRLLERESRESRKTP